MDDIDTKSLRNALGAFATGVAVVTTSDPEGRPIGMTINSFASVSLDPPLVLWSVDRNSDLFDQFLQATHYAIHVLREDMEKSSNHFTSASDKQFNNIALDKGIADLPLLMDYTSRFQCKVVHRYEAGDHVILIGHVLEMQHVPAKPLIFHAGGYAKLV
jgi:4-hydroxyphenylacetate 3-hydroxylase, reductase component